MIPLPLELLLLLSLHLRRLAQGDTAIVFKLRGRPPEGRILSRDEIEVIGYDFGLLVMHGESPAV